MNLVQSPLFKRAYKKLYPIQRKIVDEQIKRLMVTPEIGTVKKQDLQGIYAHKFSVADRMYMIAYTFDPITMKLIMLGIHENFYRDLKSYLR